MVVAPGGDAWRALTRRARRISAKDAARHGPWLVLAPHPDDETLGCGALIAAVSAAGGRVHTAFLTDGSGSHPDAPGWSAQRIAGLRRREAQAAVRILGGVADVLHLDWPDATPAKPGDPVFARSVDRLVVWCRRRGIRQIAVTWSGDPHCDHEAAAALAVAAAARLRCRLYDYLVWGWTVDALTQRLRGVRALAIDSKAGRPNQRRAMACHRSQRGGRIVGARENFRLPRAMLRLIDRPNTVLLETRLAS
ncbi:PIG-L family deacetylase [Sphingomonas sp. PP-CE-1G-424]|uniref:PIG-L deacetylase family protein n=1 Tax=Sphingomonas sp. PP-CE-1G-424 TaxID=2135658 RepID=UPI0010F1CC08|nr:PIG-L family deacetylase [Sphingomonas sp. PP-CE-1G-424]TCP71920.1 LmbE family N-acetylglucosaminyl deacetylase [Sphingomonas sp. PP-CE-1G-424]